MAAMAEDYWAVDPQSGCRVWSVAVAAPGPTPLLAELQVQQVKSAIVAGHSSNSQQPARQERQENPERVLAMNQKAPGQRNPERFYAGGETHCR